MFETSVVSNQKANKIRDLIQAHSRMRPERPDKAWRRLWRRFHSNRGIDIQRRVEKLGRDHLKVAQDMNVLDEVLEVAEKLYG